MEQKTKVLIIGAGPSGLATSTCLNLQGIDNIVLEREDCCASSWKKRAYDRLKLHLAKEFCQLPHLPFPSDGPTFVPKNDFIDYLDYYAFNFCISLLCYRIVQSATFDVSSNSWLVEAKNTLNGSTETYVSRFLVVATGENSVEFIPQICGLDSFAGVTLHSSNYKNGQNFSDKNVLVVGCGNSGMEIAYDLADWGAQTSIIIRNSVHILTKEMVQLGMNLLKMFPVWLVDYIVAKLSKMWYGDLNNYGIQTPSKGPFLMKSLTGRSPVIDVGTIHKIKNEEIKVFPGIKQIDGHNVEFVNGTRKKFEAIVFATGYRSTVRRWLKDEGRLFNEFGMPKKKKPDHWKGEDGIYCAGFSSSGLFGLSKDAMMIAEDIHTLLNFENGEETRNGVSTSKNYQENA
ncbi:OLC1v1016519C1 [Oldenlandia corymbosa var. corymbosa]|uniref:Flavin-containing monooxygenase n=1 Tax=Oldenlandia corymbosa var. corymbosa TaxID=529605 RepID=A0AAV1E5X6_OLDCO|nr:OLC1v1016519C1 [Oldenlandia corymbosa var. corymbosa]